MQRWMHPPQTNLVVGLCVAVLLLAYSTPASALSDVPSTMAVKSTAKYADDASHVHSITPLPKSSNANLNNEARRQREQQQLRTRTAASASPSTPLASGKSLLADTPAAAASSSSVVPAPAGSSPAAMAVNSSTAASNLSQPIVWPPPSTMLIAPLSADITNRIPNFSQPSTEPTPTPAEKKPVEEIEEDDPNTSEWLQRFLKPTEQDTLHASLKVHVPTNVSTVFERKQFAVRMLLDRIHATREEIDRLAAIHVESIVTIKRQMKRVSTIFRNFQKLYFVHQQAMDAPIAAKGSAKYEESKRRNAVTLLPLLYTSKRLVKEKNTLMVLLDTWKSAAPLNVETRFHLRRDVVRLQRQLGILFVEVTTLPLF